MIIVFHEGWAVVVLAADFFAVTFFAAEAFDVLETLGGEAEVLEDILLIGWEGTGEVKSGSG